MPKPKARGRPQPIKDAAYTCFLLDRTSREALDNEAQRLGLHGRSAVIRLLAHKLATGEVRL